MIGKGDPLPNPSTLEDVLSDTGVAIIIGWKLELPGFDHN